MKTYENQKTIVNNVIVSGRFYQVDEATFTAGCRDLKPTTFLVWQAINLQYFTDKELALSTAQISKLMGDIRKQTVQAAIIELIEKGWMVCLGGNHYELVSPCNEKRDIADKVYHEKCDRVYHEKCDTPITKSVTERIIINNNKEEEEEVADAPSAAKEIIETTAAPAPTNRDAASEAATQQAGEKRCFIAGTVLPWTKSCGREKVEWSKDQLWDFVWDNRIAALGRETKSEDDINELRDIARAKWNAAKVWRIAARM